MLAGYTAPDVYDIYGNTGNSFDVSMNDSNMYNYELESQGQYASMTVDPSGNVLIDAGEIPDGFTDILRYKAIWSEWVGDIYEGTYHEEIHQLIETIAVKEVASPWSIENFTTLQENTPFTVHGTGVPGATATLHLFIKSSNGNTWHELGSVEVGVDVDGEWEVSGTTPDVNGSREYKYELVYGPRTKDRKLEFFEVAE